MLGFLLKYHDIKKFIDTFFSYTYYIKKGEWKMDNTYRKLFNLDFENFYKLVNKYELDIDQEHLFII